MANKKQSKKSKPRVQITRGARGRFVKGCPSLNPSGRPRGIIDRRIQLRELFEPSKVRLIEKVISRALAGDMQAMKLCLERIVPALKPVSEPVEVSLSGTTLTEQAQAVFQAAATGHLSGDDAKTLVELLAARVKIMEASELEERLSKLERAIEGGDKDDDKK